MSVLTVDRSYEQRIRSLQKANRTRVLRSQLKQDLKAGRVSLAGVLESPPEWLGSMRVADLLMAVPQVGPDTARRTLRAADCSLAKTVGGLTSRQRRELVARLDGAVRKEKEERNRVA